MRKMKINTVNVLLTYKNSKAEEKEEIRETNAFKKENDIKIY